MTHAAQPALPRLPIVAHDAFFAGAQLLALNLARRVAESGLARPELLLGGGGELEAAMAQAAPTRLVGTGFDDAAAWAREASALAAGGVRSVICNSLVSARALPQLHAAGLTTILLVHELPDLIARYGLEDAARAAARLADLVVFPDAAVRDPFLRAFGPVAGRVMIRPQGLYGKILPSWRRAGRRVTMRARLGLQDDTFLVLGLGYGDRRKGLDLWPAIAEAARRRAGHLRFAWVGAIEDALRPALDAEIRARGLDGALLLPGRTDAPQDFMAAADAFLLSSREDPFPSAALEAAAHGLPVLCFADSGGMAGFVRETGLDPVPLGDAGAMADALVDLAAAAPARARAGAAGARLVAERYGFADYAKALVDLALPHEQAVTAIVPNYNYARFLPARIASIAAQTRRVAEIIVLDDASQDDSLAVLEGLRASTPIPIRIVPNAQNSGSVSRQWLRGLELAATPLVWIAEADDLSEPRFLEALLPLLDDPGTVMAYAQSKMIDAGGAVTAPDYLGYTQDVDPLLWQRDYRRAGHEEIAAALAVKNTIPNVSAAVFRRDAALPVMREAIDEMAALRNAGDWCFYIRLLQTGRIAFRAEALNLHRRHAAGVTIGAPNRRHLQEIAQLQALAAATVRVPEEKRRAAVAFLRHAAGHFGLAEADVAAALAAAGERATAA